MRYKYPDLVFAAVPSSAPVEMKYNFYEYFNAIKRYAPTHCVGAIERVVAYVDHILFSFFTEPKQKLKEKFGVGELAHDDDFAECMYFGILVTQYPLSSLCVLTEYSSAYISSWVVAGYAA